MDKIRLGASAVEVSKVCLGTMTFGEQVEEATAFAILDHALEHGINFIDTAEMYPVPARRETYGATETILGRWFDARPGARRRVVLASKVAGPARGLDWVRGGSNDLTVADIENACHDSLRRLRTDVIDLYQIHWPVRNVPMFGSLYLDPAGDRAVTPILEQLQALTGLVKSGKVRAIGLSNETPWGVSEFVRLAEQHGLARIVSTQNPYGLVNRVVDNGLDEVLRQTGVSLLAYSPLGFGTLTGKYDETGPDPACPELGRLARFETMRRQRWARPETLDAARRYNALAREHGLTPAKLALAFCHQSWRVASTIIGVTSVAQLATNLDACNLPPLSSDLLSAIDRIRWQIRDPAQ